MPPLSAPPGEKPAQLGLFAAPQIGQAQRRFWLIVDAMIAALVVVALTGGWAYLQVRGSLRELRAAGLASLLEAESRGMQLWIDEKKRDAERWASSPAVQREGAALAALAARGTACAAAHQRAFQSEIAPYAALEEITVLNLIARDGRVISSPHAAYCGRQVSERFMAQLAPIFEGRTVFVAPLTEAQRLGSPAAGAPTEAISWTEAPIRAADGTVVAALGFGRLASERFATLLTLSAPGTSRDAYAFDTDARMLTQPRHGAAGVVTGTLAEAALAHSDRYEGVLLEPYRNHRGADVIGAWRWLPESRMVIAVELEAAEAYGPLEHLQWGFGVLFVLVLVSMTAAASTSLWAMRVRLRAARQVGQYRLEREIAEGGMSNLYLARHRLLQRPAAIKVLKPHLATDEAVTRFQREAQLCSQLSHPNTVEIYDYGNTREGRWYYAMEYLDGASLEELVRRTGPMPAARVVHALRQACGSLKEAHDRGWVHRDVKPSNIMLCVRGGEHDFVKIVDFGLIKQVRNPDTRDITQYSRVLGTPLYMAPERLRNPADADARVDIYALAAVAWFALAGKPAFEAETDHDIVYRVMNEPAPPLGPEVPAALAALIARSLAKDRDARPAGIEEVRAILDAVALDLRWGESEARAWWEQHGSAFRAAAPA